VGIDGDYLADTVAAEDPGNAAGVHSNFLIGTEVMGEGATVQVILVEVAEGDTCRPEEPRHVALVSL
jgi:hypothetical protein